MTFPTVTCEAAFDDAPFDIPTYDVDLSARLLRVTWNLGRTRDLSDWLPSGFTLEFDNSDRELDPEYTSGTYYGSLLPRVPVRVQVTHDAATYDLLHGFAGEDGWEQSYQPPAAAECRTRCVDLLGVLAGRVLPNLYDVEVLADSPKAYWKLTDESAAARAADSSGNGYDGTYRDDGAMASRGEDGLLYGQAARVFDGVDDAVDINDAAVRLAWADLNSAEATIEAWIRTSSSPTASEYDTIYHQSGNPYGEDTTWLIITDDGKASFMWNVAGVGGFQHQTDTAWNDGTTHHVAGNVDYPGNSGSVYVDGEEQGVSTHAQPSNYHSAATIGGHPNPRNVRDYFDGEISHIAVYETALSDARILAHYSAGSAPWDGDRSGERINNVLTTFLGIPAGLIDVDDGLTVLGPAITDGRDALAYVTAVARTEQGVLTVAHWDAGQVRLIGRDALLTETRHTTSQATFTDKDAALSAGEYRYEPNLVIEPASINTVTNQVTVNYIGGTVTVEDATSVASYGPRGQSFETLHDAPSEARSFAEYVLDRYKDPITRVRELTLDCAACPENLDAALTLRVGDRVTVERKPQNLGNSVDTEYLIEGINGEIANGVNTFRVTYFLSPADTKVYGLWGTGNWDSALWAY